LRKDIAQKEQRFNPVQPIIDTRVVLLINQQKVGRGIIVKDYKTDKVRVECTSVDIGCSNRISPLNGHKTLESGENFT